jgi:hypothetical protein
MKAKDIKILQESLMASAKNANAAIAMLKKAAKESVKNSPLTDEEKKRLEEVQRLVIKDQNKMKRELRNLHESFKTIK